ncbi:unnamed protein product [Ectocarpus sp. CCAP 1310/34]|nr:unnamed protein product [Ectocarpus sp. CCAP 1310/34]
MEPLDGEQHVERRPVWAETALLLREDALSLAVVAQSCSDDLKPHSIVSPFLNSTLMVASFHCCGTSPVCHTSTTMAWNSRRRP